MRLLNQLTSKQMQDADRLESRYYGKDHMAGWQKSMEWQTAFPWMSCFIEDGGNIVAFLDLLPVHWAFYDKLMAGETDTDQLDHGDIVDLAQAAPGKYPLLLLTVILAEEYRGQGLIHRMIQDRLKFYTEIQDKGFEFPVVGTENFTADGCAFSQKQGWAPVKQKSPTHRIFQVDWTSFQNTWR